VSIAAMESTSAYWKAPFYCLEEVMEVWLLNAAHMKAVPGRKSDVRDAEWIAQLLEHGLAAAVVCAAAGDPSAADADPVSGAADGGPAPRHRPVGVDVGRRQHQAVLGGVEFEDGVGRAMLTAMITGETDPLRLADLAKGRMRRKIPDLAQALTGHFDANHARLARSMLRRLDLVEQAMAELDAVISKPASHGRIRSSCCKPFPGVGEKVRR
jgi:transposase